MKSDIEISQSTELYPITDIAKECNIPEDAIELYGKYKAKIDVNQIVNARKGKLILVTAINPTPLGEGKTTTAIGLADSLRAAHKNAILALREPSLGPVFGVKGGACGGGYAQIAPMEDINLHFTGDFHAIGAANNLLCAMVDNHIYQGNELNINPKTICIKRCVDMNDRQLRNIIDGLGKITDGMPRQDGFDITVATEVMAIFCLAKNLADLKNRLGNIIIGYTYNKEPVYAKDLKAQGAMTALLKEAFKPNLVQTLEHTPALVHGGPFANIAHGCNSIIATDTALRLGDYVITEAGFGADLGAEKFLDIKVPLLEKIPDCVVLVATIRALKHHGGMNIDDIKAGKVNNSALNNGCANLITHLLHLKSIYGLNCVVAINVFPTDKQEEIDLIKKNITNLYSDVAVVESRVVTDGSKGGKELADAVLAVCENPIDKFRYTCPYPKKLGDLKLKIQLLSESIYGAKSVVYSSLAEKQLKEMPSDLPLCVAKTQYSLSDNPSLLGAPKDYDLYVQSVELKNGAGFIVVKTGEILTMPGLPKHPAAENIDVDISNGSIKGVF